MNIRLNHFKNSQKLIFLALLFSIFLVASPAKAIFYDGGDGSSGNPYRIADCQGLQDMETSRTSTYVLTNNVDCTNFDFSPVGQSGDFSGTLDGKGFVISNLTINHSTWGLIGLFRSTNGATIKNIQFNEPSIHGDGGVGLLSGYDYGSTISKIAVNDGLVTASSSEAGGFIGKFAADGGTTTISNSYFQGNVSAQTFRVGGFIGAAESGFTSSTVTIEKSYFAGNVTSYSSSNIGGMVGLLYTSSHLALNINNSFTDATLSGNLGKGGFIGATDSLPGGKVTFSNSFFDSAGSLYDCSSAYSFSGCTGVNLDGNDDDHFSSTSTADPIASWDQNNNWDIVGSYPVINFSPGFDLGIFSPSAPLNLAVTNTPSTENSLDASWDIPISLGGGPSVARLEVFDENDASDVFSDVVFGTNKTVNGLTDGHVYTITLYYYNIGGDGPSIDTSFTFHNTPTAPALSLVQEIPHAVTSILPSYVFVLNSSENGSVTYGGGDGCTGDLSTVTAGNNTIHLGDLAAATYNCTVTVHGDDTGMSTEIDLPQFQVIDGVINSFITNCDQLVSSSNPNSYADTLVLSNDIDCTGVEMSSLTFGDAGFSGVFDGQNYTISNLSINEDADGVGLFSVLNSGATIENLNITSSTVSGVNNVGIVAGFANDANFSNVNVSGTSTASNSYAGGIFGSGYYQDGGETFDTVSFTGNVIAGTYAGGITGRLETDNLSSDLNISHLYAGGNFGAEDNSVMYIYVGGLFGNIYNTGSSEAAVLNISNSTSTVNLFSNSMFDAGGIIGSITVDNAQGPSVINITSSTATGNIYNEYSVGGFIGDVNVNPYDQGTNISVNISHSSALGDVVGMNDLGGFVGHVGILGYAELSNGTENLFVHFFDDYATGNVSGNGTVGGFLGSDNGEGPGVYLSSNYTGGLTLENVYATGNVTSEYNAGGGLVGQLYCGSSNSNNPFACTVKNSFASSTVIGNTDNTAYSIGGLIGSMYGDITIHDSYSVGSVTGSYYVGGLIGFIYPGNSTTIYNTYASSSVNSHGPMGGLIGYIQNNGANVSVSGSFAVFSMNDDGESGGVGWLIGGGESQASLTNLSNLHFFNTNSFNHASDCVYDVSTGSQQCYNDEADTVFFATSSAPLSSWDFDNIWLAHDSALPTLNHYIVVDNSYSPDYWTGKFWNVGSIPDNPSFPDRDPDATVTSTEISFNWSDRSPAGGIGSSDYMDRWTRNVDVATAGDYNFFTSGDDGVRIFVDDVLLVNDQSEENPWSIHGTREYDYTYHMTTGTHKFRFEHYQGGGGSTASFSTDLPLPPVLTVNSVDSEELYDTQHQYVYINTNHAGTVYFTGDCGANTTTVYSGENIAIKLSQLDAGTYDNCVAHFIDNLGGTATASVPSFLVDTAPVVEIDDTDNMGCQNLSAILDGGYDYYSMFKLTSDIDCTGVNFTPIGWNTESNFYSILNGQGHTIHNLTINMPEDYSVGLIAQMGDGKIENLNFDGGTVTGYRNVGAVVGYAFSGDIVNVHSTLSVYGHDSGYYGHSRNIGGLVGYIDLNGGETARILDSSVTSTVFGFNRVGGLVGRSFVCDDCNTVKTHVLISNSSFVGNINSASLVDVGGIVGQVGNDDGSSDQVTTIQNCFTDGTITGEYDLGGLIGYGNAARILNSYSNMDIKSFDGDSGGLVGESESNLYIHNSYSTGNISAVNDYCIRCDGSIGGLVGYMNSYSLSDEPNISESYSTSHLLGDWGIGGLVGDLEGRAKVKDSYFSGQIDGTYDTGGLVGYMYTYDDYLENSYFSGTINAIKKDDGEGGISASTVGGIVGLMEYGHISNVFAAGNINTDVDDEKGGAFGYVAGNDSIAISNVYYDQARTGFNYCSTDFYNEGTCIGVNGDGVDEHPTSSSSYFFNNGGDGANVPLDSWDFSSVWHSRTSSFPSLLDVAAGSIHYLSDTTSPANVTGLVAVKNGGNVDLSWTNPTDEDFYGVVIRKGNNNYFESQPYSQDWNLDNDGFVANNVSGTTYSDSDTFDDILNYSLFTFDKNGNYSGPVTTSIDFSFPTPVILDVTTTVSTSSVTFSWNVDSNTNGYVEYGFGSGWWDSDVVDNDMDTDSHTVTVENLNPCTRYSYHVDSQNTFGHIGFSDDAYFITAGCSADATPISVENQSVSYTDNSTTTLSSSDNTISVIAPANFTSTTVTIQIKSLSAGAVLGSIGQPNSLVAGASVVFDVKALLDISTVLDSFDLPVTISYTYSDSDISGVDESSLWLYHYHGGEWLPLDSCDINTGTNTITCTAPSFSIFSLFGTPVVAPVHNSSGGGSSYTYGCTDSKALNYNPSANRSNVPSTCQYAPVTVATTTVSSTVVVVPPVVSVNDLSCAVKLYLTKPVRFGATNNKNDVKLLQKFLDTDEGENLIVDGVYKKADYEAVIRWQEKYSDEILKPWGLKKGTGYVYTTSLKKIKSIHEAACKDKQPVVGQPSVSSKFIFNRDLKVGSVGEDVRQLQIFLNKHGYDIVKSGPGSAGQEITKFGLATKKALVKFQEDHSDELLVPAKLKKGNGNFVGKTRSLINSIN